MRGYFRLSIKFLISFSVCYSVQFSPRHLPSGPPTAFEESAPATASDAVLADAPVPPGELKEGAAVAEMGPPPAEVPAFPALETPADGSLFGLSAERPSLVDNSTGMYQ